MLAIIITTLLNFFKKIADSLFKPVPKATHYLELTKHVQTQRTILLPELWGSRAPLQHPVMVYEPVSGSQPQQP